MSDRIGTQIGNYRLQSLLGYGGFGEVYLGEHTYLNTQAAIKVLQTQLGQNDLPTFLNEARTIANLIHPNIVRVLEFGESVHTPYLVMDYAPSGTLRQRYPRGTRLPLAEVVSYVKQIAAALQYAHDRKIIHRDVKPENMLVGRNGEILLSDFGIAIVSQSSRYQSQQEMGGTVAYMAPEQLQGKAAPASDQYALAMVAYEWLTGELPFKGSFAEIGSQHLFASPPSLQMKVPGLPQAIDQVVQTALAKNPQQRFGRVQDFAIALEQASQNISMPLPVQTDATVLNDQANISTYVKPISGQPLPPTILVSAQHERTQPVQTIPAIPPISSFARTQSNSSKKIYVTIISVLVLLLLGIGVWALPLLISKQAGSVASTQPRTSSSGESGKNTSIQRTTPLATPTPVVVTVTKNLRLTCTTYCDHDPFVVVLDSIGVDKNSGQIAWNFTVTNKGQEVCNHARGALFLEDPAGVKVAGRAPGGFTEESVLNIDQTIHTYTTVWLAAKAGVTYTLHTSTVCTYWESEYQTETFTF